MSERVRRALRHRLVRMVVDGAEPAHDVVRRHDPTLPPRPAIPPALWCLAVVIGVECATLSWSLGRDGALAGRLAVISATLAAAACVVLLILRRRGHEVAQHGVVIVLLTLLAASVAARRGSVQHARLDLLGSHAVSGWEFEALGDATPSAYGYRCKARARRVQHPQDAAEVWLSLKEPVTRGERLRCVGRFRRPGDDEFGRAGWCQGISGTVTAVRIVRREAASGVEGAFCDVRTRALATLDPARSVVRALMAGCVCGYRSALDEQGLTDAFSRCGIAHLIAVSGTHLALVCSLTAQLLGALELAPGARLPLLALASGLFVVFCGAPVSAVRAWAMSLAAFGSELAGRRAHAPSSVGLVGLLMALADPTVSGQLGFLLSVTSVTALALFGPYVTYALQVLMPHPRLPRWVGAQVRRTLASCCDGLRSTLAATLVCQMATLPLVASTFGRISLVVPLANVVLGVPVTALTAGGLVCVALGPLGVSGPLLLVADQAGPALMAALNALGSLPYASVALSLPPLVLAGIVTACAAVLLAIWPHVERRAVFRFVAGALVIAACLVARWWLFAPARIVVLDVGQGDAILVQEGIHAVLVDAGPEGTITTALARNHVLGLDAVVVTHLHDDHYGGVADLAGIVPCGAVIVARGVADTLDEGLAESFQAVSGASPREMGYGDLLRVGHFTLRMVWPTDPVDGDENCESIELAVTYERGDVRMEALLTGDAERDETGACVRAGDVGDIDVLKVGHHGSEVSIDAVTAAVLRPEVAVASAGKGNSYGHPAPACRAVLESVGARFVCTIDAGDVDLRPSARGVIVRRQRR